MKGRIGALLLGWSLFLGATADTGSERLRAFLSDLRSLQGDFQQVLFDEDRTRLEEARGVFWLQRPGRFRWHYQEPYPQLIVADGKNVWVYDRELKQVTVKPLADALGSTPAFLLSSDHPLEESFTIEDLGSRDGLTWVELKPRSTEVHFSSIQLGFRGEELRRMELIDSFGQLTKLRFQDTRENVSLDPALFVFTPPDGVDVIGASSPSPGDQPGRRETPQP